MNRVLLLDDDPAQLSVRQLLLQKLGSIEAVTATEGTTALELLRSEGGRTIGAVVTDHLMPDMDGLEFVRRLRAFNRDIPVIVTSGLPEVDAAYEGMNVHFLPKPCEPEDLIATLKTVLGGSQQRAS